MIELIAIRQIRHACGSIETGQVFIADEHEAERYIKRGDALRAYEYEQRPWSGRGFWSVTPEWKGETVAIVAGGPSLTSEQVEQVKPVDVHETSLGSESRSFGVDRVIAINNAAQLAPWADILYFCDDRWYVWHRVEVDAFKGIRVTLENLKLQNEIEVRCLRDYGVTGFAPRNDGVTNGRNSGYQALHLAALLGAARVLLLGFDMRQVDGRMHWHKEHPIGTPPNIFKSWIDAFDTLKPELQRRGVEVINCSPQSALTAFPLMSLADALHPHGNDQGQHTDVTPEHSAPIVPLLIEPTPVHQEAVIEPEPHEGSFGGAGATGEWSAPDVLPDSPVTPSSD
jgi:hypothetical protein